MSKPSYRNCFQYLPQAASDPELLQQREHTMPTSNSKVTTKYKYATSEQFEISMGAFQYMYTYDYL